MSFDIRTFLVCRASVSCEIIKNSEEAYLIHTVGDRHCGSDNRQLRNFGHTLFNFCASSTMTTDAIEWSPRSRRLLGL
jgi:hypothetical protein